ncbi:NifB/NifX family molybdenum-iron cluster-binding protein [Clostridium sp. HBUAS56010]|uniref:NifB/NifX family molybdenum-iron cluster-binding protein n=1 Tax=Clostridium sp. HBUAS56010 TaxID=2571127 RepID=UPI001177F8E0|nr:NifB/NifX family molybdenum-iron cluster-binding protein [Clostridium sp. HBUAS56010]
MKYKIGIASSDGKVINLHFGRADVFYIVEADSEDMTFRYGESRQTIPVCQGQEHDNDKLLALADILKDCDYVLVSKIGEGARAALAGNSTLAFELPGFIEDSVKRLLSYVEVEKLLNDR